MSEDLKLVAEAKLFEQQMLKEVQLTDKTRLEADELRAVALRNNSSDFRNRVYNFLGPISLDSVEKAANTILGWDRASQAPITLRLMSPGGEVPSGLYLFDLLASMAKLGTPIRTVAIGNANSMAAVVLQAGSHRVVGENSWITLHEVSVSGSPFESMTVTEKEEQDATVRRINTRLVRILARRMTITPEQLAKKIRKRDWTLEPEQAVELGLADSIGYK